MRKYVFFLSLLVTIIKVNAQIPAYERIEYGEDSIPRLVVFKSDTTIFSLSNANSILKKVLKLTEDDNFLIKKSFIDDQGSLHERYQHYYKGLKVEFSEYNIHSMGGRIVSINGSITKIGSLNISPDLSETVALDYALKYVNANVYMWEIQNDEDSLLKERNDYLSSFYPKGELIIWTNWNSKDSKLAYKFKIYSKEPYQHIYVYVDACTGKVIDVQQILKNEAVTGTAVSRYSGTVNLTTDSIPGTFRLRDPSRGNGIVTMDMNQSSNPYDSVNFADNDNIWTAAEWDNAQMDNAAFDAHYGAQLTYDYFEHAFRRQGWDNNNSRLVILTHFSNNWNNGGWDSYNQHIILGDGDGLFFNPFTDLDFLAHEYGHAISDDEIGLNSNGEPGAIDEGLSDIWAACVEHFASIPGNQIWIMGEDVEINPTHRRNMQNPDASHYHEYNNLMNPPIPYPDTYMGDGWYTGAWDDYGRHINSTVLSHWFFLLSQGAEDINPIGFEKAAQIVYQMERVYLVPNSTYSDARTYSIQAAINIYGRCSEEVESVTNAWHAVGVGPEWENPEYDLLMTYDQDCNAVTLTVRDLNTWEPITWVATNGLLINGNSSPYIGYGGSVTISSPDGLGGVISAIIGDACSTTSFEFCPCLTWDASITWIWSSPMPGEPLQAEVSPLHPEAMKYHWFVNGELIEITEGSGYLSTYNWPCVWDGEGLTVNGITSCGATVLIYGGNYSPLCNYSMASNVNLYPNPASLELTIALDETLSSGDQIDKNIPSISLATITQVKLIDKTGMTRKLMNFGIGNTSVRIMLSEIQSGVYYLDVTDGDRHVIKPLIIKK